MNKFTIRNTLWVLRFLFTWIIVGSVKSYAAEVPAIIAGDTVKISPTEKFDAEIKISLKAPVEMGGDSIFHIGVSTKKIGVIEQGSFKGFPLILTKLKVKFEGPCYPPPSCGDDIQYQRFIRTDKEMVLITKATQAEPPWADRVYGAAGKNPLKGMNPFKALELDLKTDSKTELAGFEAPKAILFNQDSRKKIEFLYETDFLDESNFEKLKNASSKWEVYALNPKHSKAQESFKQSHALKFDEFSNRPRNVFFIKKPDGIYSIYKYSPDIYQRNRISKKYEYRYTHHASVDCSGLPADFLDILEPKFDKRNLVTAGKTFNGDQLYFAPDPMLKELFKLYQNSNSQFENKETESVGEKDYSEGAEPATFQEFKNMAPILLWKNPLGQWVRFVRVRFLEPFTCS